MLYMVEHFIAQIENKSLSDLRLNAPTCNAKHRANNRHARDALCAAAHAALDAMARREHVPPALVERIRAEVAEKIAHSTLEQGGEGEHAPLARRLRAAALHARIFTIDTHCDTPTLSLRRPGWDITQRHDVPTDDSQVDFPRMREGGRLADIAPTVLHLMGLPKPSEMTGESLVAR